jgi:voltage-gated potassium channel
MSFSRLIIKICYTLENSVRYNRLKGHVYDLLENPRAPIRPYFDIFLILLVLVSVWLLIYGVKRDLGGWVNWIEVFAVSIFILEYLLRFWVYNNSHQVIIEHFERAQFINEPFQLWPALGSALVEKLRYMIQPMAIIDLLAIVPSYRPLRFLRIFLLFRLFKLFRYTRSISEFVKVLSEKRIELVTLFIFMAFITFTAATAIFFFEADQQDTQVTGFFDSIYWALVTISTVGYGDITPHTTEGRLITLVLIVVGLGVISFFTSIIVSAFGEKIDEIREHRIFSEVERKNIDTVICGYGRIGQMVAERLAGDRRPFVLVDPLDESIKLAKQRGYLAILGHGEDNDLLSNLGIATRIKRLLCLTGDDVVNVYITLMSRQLNPNIEIISRANHRENVDKLYRAGATHCVAPYEVFGLIAAEYAGQPVAFEAVYGLLAGQFDEGIEAVRIQQTSPLVGKSIGEVDFKARKLIPFGVIREDAGDLDKTMIHFQLEKGSFYFNPGENFILQPHDLLVLFGHKYSMVHLRKSLEKGILS